MKQKYLFALSLVASLLFGSCSDELDIKSEASLSATAPLATEDVDKLLTGVYQKVMKPGSIGYFNVMASEIMSDNYRPVNFQWFQVGYLYEHKTPSDDILLSYFYFHFYNAINRANVVLNVSTASNDQKGKARFCRAFTYLRLFDLFEKVPLVDEKFDNKPIAPSSKSDVLNFIVNDLKYAKDNCNHFDSKNLTKSQLEPTSEAAAALLARVYRLQGNIAAAGKEAEELISKGNFKLSANPSENATEVILKFAGNKGEKNGYWGYIMSPAAQAWNCFACSKDLVDLLKPADKRNSLFATKKVNGESYVFSTKYATDNNSDLLIARIAEMYLISAEAGNDNRLKEFQAVRQSSLTLDEERRLELSFEWIRWSDLKLKGQTYRLPYPQEAVDANPLLKK